MICMVTVQILYLMRLKGVNVLICVVTGKINFYDRPSIEIFSTHGGGNFNLGKIVAPFQLCNHGVEVYDMDNILIYIVEASCCQAIFWIDLPCKSCQTCKFTVYDGQKQVKNMKYI